MSFSDQLSEACSISLHRTLLSATARIYLSNVGADPLTNIKVTISAPAWAYSPQSIVVARLEGKLSTPRSIFCPFFVRQAIPPSSMAVTASAAYIDHNSLQRCLNVSFRLPLSLAARVIFPVVRGASFKLTLETDSDAVSLGLLFEDMIMETGVNADASGSKSALSFEFWFGCSRITPDWNGSQPNKNHKTPRQENLGAGVSYDSSLLPRATILISKHTGKYRVQATSLTALWLIVDELCFRLKNHLGNEDVNICYREPLPLSDFYAAVDRHHTARKKVRVAEASLNHAANQFRVIQKRLLTRFKDGRPAPLKKMDVLMRRTHENLLQLTSHLDIAQNDCQFTSHTLACATQLLLILIRLQFSLSPAEYNVLRKHLSPDILACNPTSMDEAFGGWEEMTDASITHMLRFSLGRQGHAELSSATRGRKMMVVPPVLLTFLTTTERLKRHIAMVCDRLDRGSRPVCPN